ncbi:8906_t:CDS:2 [Funneliformis mosseae]|uniref:8906_t:CDS:1 n=1 Tax=Funneliformis mosseae TaxID=27381 RepID=A0A9N8ZV73_FUNMO|nr:8906_t:CDS:2 [Funneliformis mosseae]
MSDPIDRLTDSVTNGLAIAALFSKEAAVIADSLGPFIPLISEITHIKFTNLTDEFDGLMRVLNFTMAVQNQIQMEEDHKVLISDYLKTIEGGIVNDLKEINASLDDITQLNIAWQKRVLQEDNNVLESATIKMTEIHDPHETVKRGTKVYKKIRMGEDIAIKEKILGDDEKKLMNDILSQVVILKKLKESQYILQFYGIAQDANAIYMVTEWCDYGNLQEFYQDYGPLDWHEKTQLAVDIARGLTFLHTVAILHHDIRSENILITIHRQAKLANFTLSRGFNDPTKNMMPTIDTVRWMAPEKLKDHRNLYTAKCEIYRNLIVQENIRPSFSNTIPPEWVKVTYQALQDSPNARPPLRDMFMTLNHLCSKFAPPPSSRPNSSRYPTDDDLPSDDELDLAIEDLSISVLTVREAILEHKKKDGDKVKSWESFKYHAEEFNDITARYWKGYYLYYGLCPIDDPSDAEAKRARLEEAANLFKEAADYGLSDAQLRYGHCLWSGDGVRKSISQAIEYFQLSADGGNPTAMYNIGNLYYNGLGVQKDEEKGIRYLRLAALREQPKAFEMCKRKCISLV